MTSRVGTAICAAVFCLAGTAAPRAFSGDDVEESEAAEAGGPTTPSGPTTTDSERARGAELTEVSGIPIFIPPERGAPRMRIGAGTRDPSAGNVPQLWALVPRETGLTLEEQPILYWYLARPIDTGANLTVIHTSSGESVLDAAIEGPLGAGVHPVRLGDYELALKTGETYQWFVGLVLDSDWEEDEIVAGGGIRRVKPDENLRSELAAATPARVPFILAAAGIWYDAIGDLSARIEASPGDTQLRVQRAALLEQVGLAAVGR